MLPLIQQFLLSLHHSEPADPTLIAWIISTIDSVIDPEPYLVIIIVGAIVIAIPTVLLLSAVRRSR